MAEKWCKNDGMLWAEGTETLEAVETINESFQATKNQKIVRSTAEDQLKVETESDVQAQLSDRRALTVTVLECVGFTQAGDQLKMKGLYGCSTSIVGESQWSEKYGEKVSSSCGCRRRLNDLVIG